MRREELPRYSVKGKEEERGGASQSLIVPSARLNKTGNDDANDDDAEKSMIHKEAFERQARRASCLRTTLIVSAILLVLVITALLIFYFLFWPKPPTLQLVRSQLQGPGMTPLRPGTRLDVVKETVGRWLSSGSDRVQVELNVTVNAVNENKYELEIGVDHFLLEWILQSLTLPIEEANRQVGI